MILSQSHQKKRTFLQRENNLLMRWPVPQKALEVVAMAERAMIVAKLEFMFS